MVSEAYRKTGRNFTFPGYQPSFPRNPAYQITHYKFNIEIDFNKKTLIGKSEFTFKLRKRVKEISLDAVDMEIKEVTLNGEKAFYTYDGRELNMEISKPSLKTLYKAEISYEVVEPRYGFHFVDEIPMVYTQGETIWNRHWLPIYDEPNMKFTTEAIIKVPKGWKAFSNGDLIEHRVEDDWEVWHYKNDFKIPSYLIALIAGDMYVEEEYVDDIKLEYIVPAIYSDRVKTTFKNTPDMIKFFNEWTGVKYPYRVYRQAAARNFLVGGMENLTLTIINDNYLMDEHSRKDFRVEGLLSHELAHQWFGDLVTCRDWSHIWINEGFATFFNNLYFRHWLGREEYIYMLVLDMDTYLAEYRSRYSRPPVYRVYKYPEEMFDRHVYQRGGLLLNMLMNLVGEDKFRRIVKLFLQRFRYSNADTEDFRKVVEEVTGENFEWFFETFFYNSGHPEIEVRYAYDRGEGGVKIDIEQKQGDDSPEVYKLPLDILMVFKDGSSKRVSYFLRDRKTSIFIPTGKRPAYVLVDPDLKLFMKITPRYGLDALENIVFNSQSTYWRILAARALGEEKSKKAVDILVKVILEDKFYGVAREAAKALGNIKTEYAKKMLIEVLGRDLDPRVKASVIEALGNYRGEEIGEALTHIVEDEEEAYSVRANAFLTMAKSRYSRVKEYLAKYIDTPSFSNIITAYILRAYGEIADEESYEIIKRYSGYDKPENIRRIAIEQLGNFPNNREVYKLLDEYVETGGERIRRSIVAACKKLFNSRALNILNKVIMLEKSGFVVKDAMLTKKNIEEALEKGEEYKKIKEQILKLEDEYRRLANRLDTLESRM